jgi:hypothetical protein
MRRSDLTNNNKRRCVANKHSSTASLFVRLLVEQALGANRVLALTPTTQRSKLAMVEANPTISQSLRFSMSGAVMTLAQREAEKAVKQEIRDKGVRKVSQVKRREIAALGREYLIAHRHLILARTAEGRQRAQARGVKFGRKPALTKHQRDEALARVARGETLMEIARSYNVSHMTISRLG